jgi:hypothetical protein
MFAFRMVLIGLLTFALAGCSDDTDPLKTDNGVPPNKDGGAVDVGKKPDKMKPDTVAAKTAQVCGYTEDSAGKLLTNHPVIVCNEHIGCWSDDTSGTGLFCVSLETPGEYIVHATTTTRGGKTYLDTYFPQMVTKADIAAEKKLDVGKFMVPHTAKALQKVDIPKGGTYDLGGGVSVTIAAGAAKKPPLNPDLQIGAAVVAKGKIHKNASTYYKGSGTLAFAVAFTPLETTFTTPVEYKFPSQGLKDGTKVELHFMDEKFGKFAKQGDGEVKSGQVVNLTGQGLKALGWVLVYTK